MSHDDLNRRHFMTHTAAALAMVQVLAGCEEPHDPETPLPPPDVREPLEPLVSNDDFYQVTHGGSLPMEWPLGWNLEMSGLVEGDQMISLATLKELGETVIEHTLECISNRSYLSIGNALWGGVYLSELLAAMGLTIQEDAAWIAFTCGDGYRTSLPLSVLDDGLFLAWSMNGVALPRDHGEPVRVLVPGRFGMKNPKWLKSLAFAAAVEPGTWESVGWSEDAFYKLHSYIHEPRHDEVVSLGGTDLLGSAFAGSAAIARVEVSDDRQTWHEAELTHEGGPNVWTLWRYRWVPPSSGEHTIWVRAIDEFGHVQDANADADPNPLDGYDGVYKVVLST